MRKRFFNLMTLQLAACAALMGSAGNHCSGDQVNFANDIAPILQTYCVGCHTADDPEGGLIMESYDQLMRGGDSGLSVTAGTANSSRLFMMLTGELDPVMPPEDEPRPSEAEIELLAEWIEQGALGPSGRQPLKRTLRVPQIDSNPAVELPVTAIAISPDGQLRAIARYGSVELRDKTDKLVSKLTKELGKVNGLEFSRDGARLLVASGVPGAYGNAALFEVATGEMLNEWIGHRDTLYAATFSPDETIVATAGYDREIILWDSQSGVELRRLLGHNGAIFDLAFSPDGKVLCSACADETVKVWNVATGERLDTLGQPTGEVFAVDVTPDGKHILAASGDNRLRVWSLKSTDKPAINPLIVTRFVDESPLVDFSISRDGKSLVAMGQAGNLKVLRTTDWNQMATLDSLADVGSDLAFSTDGSTLMIAMMSGELVERTMPRIASAASDVRGITQATPIYIDLGELTHIDEVSLNSQAGPAADLPRGVTLRGRIAEPGRVDSYRWRAKTGEVWAIDADAVPCADENDQGTGRLDPVVAIFDEADRPVLRVRLQAIRDTYFTFRGKDSEQSDDFRLFNWQELNLGEYLYAAGEVTRLWMHPRGPDSGFNVYPGSGMRWTYFGTTQTTHALGEPAYIVRPLSADESPMANGLPSFDVYYENDDDPFRNAGKNSRLLFTAPQDGRYTVRLTDTRGEGADEGYEYDLRIRPAQPHYTATINKAKSELRRGTGREFTVKIQRFDGFNGPVTFECPDVPDGIVINVPLTIEAGQNAAIGTVWVSEDAQWKGKRSASLVASADINGRRVERAVGSIGEFELKERPSVIPSIQPVDREVGEDETWTLQVHRGSTVSARVKVRRKQGFTNEVKFGNETSGRNASQGVYVDNIGLNGLLIVADANEREFFLTADHTAAPGQRSFFLTAQLDGNVTTHPIIVEVLP